VAPDSVLKLVVALEAAAAAQEAEESGGHALQGGHIVSQLHHNLT
jgi:hypothetical protein